MAEFSPGGLVDDRYKLVSRLGSGGMADVYLAEDQQLGRKVALKLLHRRFAQDPDFVERFRREAQAAAGLQHPNIVGVYDRGTFDDTSYIAMEYLPGRSLKQLIRDEAPLPPVRAIDLTIQILQAARFAHRHGVIHRDLKPHNVIVDDAEQAKVTDFGIARAGASDMTETGSIMGTAQYLSPEQAQGHAVSAASDLYSVAVVLYELLTGRVPFDADSPVTIALKHVAEAPTAPTRLNAAIPPDLERVVMWALNKSPADRPQDADQLIDALERVKASLQSGGRGQATAAIPALAGVGAYRAAAATAATTAAPRANMLVGDGNGGPPVVEEPPPPDERRRSRWPWLALLLVALLVGAGVAAYLLTRPTRTVIPNVVGQSVNDASAILQNDGFAVSTISVPNPKRSGTVIRQSPVANTKADEGSTVTLTESSGPGTVTVPGVIGLPKAQARKRLLAKGLKVGDVVNQNSDSVAAGDVISTSPQAGTPVPGGTSIELIVSSGKGKVTVPDVTGQPASDAKAQLTAAGFTVTTSTQTSSSVQAGNVISQSPSPGTAEPAGTTVALVIASAPTTATVPDVSGQTAAAAASQLTQAGFKVRQQNKTVTDQTKDGIVLSEIPAQGTTQRKGATITIVVGRYQQPQTTTQTTPTTTTTTTTKTSASGGTPTTTNGG